MSQKSYIQKNQDLSSYAGLNFLELDSHQKIWKSIIDKHPFNYALSITIPGNPEQLQQQFDSTLGHYYQVEAPLSVLLNPTLLEQIKSEHIQLSMHTVETCLETDDVLVLEPSGKLYMSLIKETFETFGMTARSRSKADVRYDKHVVEMDMTAKAFVPGKNNYDRFKWCVENTLTQSFKMVFCAVDTLTGTTVDIEWPSDIRVSKQDIRMEMDVVSDANIPSFDTINYKMTDQPPPHWEKDAEKALEWLGLAQLKAKRLCRLDKREPFVSVYNSPAPFLDNQQTCVMLKWKGFIPSPIIQSIMVDIRKHMKNNSNSQWAAMSVWGYKDSPFTWQIPHYSYLNGENDYTFLLLPRNNTCYTFQLYGSHHYI